MGEASGTGHQASAKKGKREPDLRLLCERCGYHLKGLKRSDVCPECGKPVVESLPERRVGSAWQRRPGWRAWWKTVQAVIAHPIRCWDVMRVQRARNRTLVVLNCGLAGAVLYLFGLAYDAVKGSWETEFMSAAMAIDGTLLAMLYLTLTWIEGVGIGVVSHRKKWRIQVDTKRMVLACASFAWIPCALMALGAVLLHARFFDTDTLRGQWISLAFAGGGFIAGLLLFEALVYIGMRKMKYANAPGSERELVEEGISHQPSAISEEKPG